MGYRIVYGRTKRKRPIWILVAASILALGILIRGNRIVHFTFAVQAFNVVDSLANELGKGAGWGSAVSVFWEQLTGNEDKAPI